ncbi:unnamed protein product [Arctia plantaginis]|uniref:LITAF domain-containing protein n=1 Tax=Arctia plantaginis TaxID=874455 RepID=A0A8S1BEA6_ARCPL|nr:unnamed protein product [Arctia plantaginis]CAB3258142.1 unnamed protein product [Arctia plantaginis]
MDSGNDKGTRVSQPPPYSEYPGPAPQPQTYVAAPVVMPVVVASRMGPEPTPFVCKSCHAQIVTRIETKPTTKTHLFALLLCVIGCWPCVCIPYCVDSCNNTNHYCPNCNAYLGSYDS